MLRLRRLNMLITAKVKKITIRIGLKSKEIIETIRFADNIDTRSALDALRELVGATHLYLRNTQPHNSPLLAAAARYVTDMLHIFGAIDGPRGGIGFPVGDAGSVDVCLPLFWYKSFLTTGPDRRHHRRKSRVNGLSHRLPNMVVAATIKEQ